MGLADKKNRTRLGFWHFIRNGSQTKKKYMIQCVCLLENEMTDTQIGKCVYSDAFRKVHLKYCPCLKSNLLLLNQRWIYIKTINQRNTRMFKHIKCFSYYHRYNSNDKVIFFFFYLLRLFIYFGQWWSSSIIYHAYRTYHNHCKCLPTRVSRETLNLCGGISLSKVYR